MERGSTRSFSPSSERRRKVSIKVPEPTTLRRGSPDSFWATKVRMSTGLVAIRRAPAKFSAMSFPTHERTMPTLPARRSRRDPENFPGAPTVKMTISLAAASSWSPPQILTGVSKGVACRRSSASPRTRSWSSSTRTISRHSRLCNRAWAHVTPTWPQPMTEMRGRWETMRKPRIRRRHRAGSESTQAALYMRGGSRRARASDARLIAIAQDLNGG
jgi:hypothetical protein